MSTAEAAGYLLALDDFRDTPEWQPLVALADFIKVDVLATAAGRPTAAGARNMTTRKIRMLAEKVETYEDFHRTQQWGYTYFQGFFFSRPEMLSRRDIPANKMNYLLVLQAVNREEMDIDEVSDKIKSETSLSFRLLRYLNSPAFPLIVGGALDPTRSCLAGRTRRAQMGFHDCGSMHGRRQAHGTGGAAADARAILRTAGRSRREAGIRQRSFSAGTFVGHGCDSGYAHVRSAEGNCHWREIRNALLGKSNGLRKILDLVMNYERGNWDEISREARSLGIADEVITERYLESVDWAQQVLSGHSVAELKPA